MELVKLDTAKKHEAATKELLDAAKDFNDKVLDGTVKGFAIIAMDKDGSAVWWQSWPHNNSFEAYGLINRLKDVFRKEHWK